MCRVDNGNQKEKDSITLAELEKFLPCYELCSELPVSRFVPGVANFHGAGGGSNCFGLKWLRWSRLCMAEIVWKNWEFVCRLFPLRQMSRKLQKLWQ